jgi:hypothetical protein
LALPTQVCAIGLLLLLYEGRDTIVAQGGRHAYRTYQGVTSAETLV